MAVVPTGGMIAGAPTTGVCPFYAEPAASQPRTAETRTTCQEAASNHFYRIKKSYGLRLPSLRALVQHVIANPSLAPTVGAMTQVAKHRFWTSRTSLGKALAEVQYSQETRERTLLPAQTLEEADGEAEKLLQKLEGSSLTRLPDGKSVIIWSKNGVKRARLLADPDRSLSPAPFRIALNPDPTDRNFQVTSRDGMLIFAWERNNLVYARVISMTPQATVGELPSMDLVVAERPPSTGARLSFANPVDGPVSIHYDEATQEGRVRMERTIDPDTYRLGEAQEVR